MAPLKWKEKVEARIRELEISLQHPQMGRAQLQTLAENELVDERDWCAQESWVWEKIRNDARANLEEFTSEYHSSESMYYRHTLRASFIEKIIRNEAYIARIGKRGIHIDNAIITGNLDLTHLRFNSKLRFEKCTFEQPINLDDCRIEGWLVFVGSHLKKGDNSRVLSLRGAHVTELDLSNVIAEGEIYMDGIHITSHLILRGADCKDDLKIIFSSIDASLDLSHAKLTTVDLSSSRFGEIRFGSGTQHPPCWKGSKCGLLVLNNTYTTAWQIAKLHDNSMEGKELADEVWPQEVRPNHFIYDRLGGYTYYGRGARDTRAWRDMLELGTKFYCQ